MAQNSTQTAERGQKPTHSVSYREIEEITRSGQRVLGTTKSITINALVETETVLEGIDEQGRRVIVPRDNRELSWARDKETLDIVDVLGTVQQVEEVA